MVINGGLTYDVAVLLIYFSLISIIKKICFIAKENDCKSMDVTGKYQPLALKTVDDGIYQKLRSELGLFLLQSFFDFSFLQQNNFWFRIHERRLWYLPGSEGNSWVPSQQRKGIQIYYFFGCFQISSFHQNIHFGRRTGRR